METPTIQDLTIQLIKTSRGAGIVHGGLLAMKTLEAWHKKNPDIPTEEITNLINALRAAILLGLEDNENNDSIEQLLNPPRGPYEIN